MTDLKNILWLPSWYPSKVDQFNGDFIQRHAIAVSEFCNVYVIYVVKDNSKERKESEINFNENLTEVIIYYKAISTGINFIDRFLSHWKYIKTYKKAIKEFIAKYGIPQYVHVHIAMKAGLLALWVKNKWKIPYLVTENWTGYYLQSVPSIQNYNWYFKKIWKQILKEATMFLPVTLNLGETVKRNYINIPYHPIPNVVDTNLFYFKPDIQPKFRFIHISYMNFQKNPEGILAATKKLKDLGYNFDLLMIGNQNKSLFESVAKFHLTNDIVCIKPAITYAEVAKELQMASAFVLFSRFENLPCVILEALCCGLPVISSRVGGIDEVVMKENGILIESEDIDGLVSAMKLMIDDYQLFNKANISQKAIGLFNYYTVGQQIAQCYH